MASDTNRFHDRAGMRVSQTVKKTRQSWPQYMHQSVQFKLHMSKTDIDPYCEVLNYLLATYASADIIAEIDMHVKNFKQPCCQSAVQYVLALWTKALQTRPRWFLYQTKFIEGLRQPYRKRFEAIGVRTSRHRYRNSPVTHCPWPAFSRVMERWNKKHQDLKRQPCVTLAPMPSWRGSPLPILRTWPIGSTMKGTQCSSYGPFRNRKQKHPTIHVETFGPQNACTK